MKPSAKVCTFKVYKLCKYLSIPSLVKRCFRDEDKGYPFSPLMLKALRVWGVSSQV